MVLVLWSAFIMAIVYKYAKILINLFDKNENLSINDDDIVGHASYSDSESDSESDSDYIGALPDDPREPCDSFMNDFYEETTFTTDWLALNDEEKLRRLDKELDEYMSNSKCDE